VKPLTSLDLRSFGAGIFPSSLPWDTVERICRENNTDLLFSLELFDTESKISYGASPTSINTVIANIPAIQQQASMTTLVKTGWRIYDPSSRNILDEYIISRDIVFSGKGINPLAAGSALIGRKEAVKQVGNKAGQAYAYRIVPYSIRVSRYYYTGGNGNFTIARRMAQTGNWDGAAKIWQQETTNANGKLAGRASYNMAIISEINGDLDGAIQWAQKAYENYNNRLALSYVNVLRNRKADNALLKAQNEVTSTP
jgi:tetratricopeptide (TPR) repeat protein